MTNRAKTDAKIARLAIEVIDLYIGALRKTEELSSMILVDEETSILDRADAHNEVKAAREKRLELEEKRKKHFEDREFRAAYEAGANA